MPRDWFVYMLDCDRDTLYTGIAVDVAARYAKHCGGKGAAYTRAFAPRRILAVMPCASRSEALKAEHAVKQLDRIEKLAWARRWRAPAGTKKTNRKPARGKP